MIKRKVVIKHSTARKLVQKEEDVDVMGNLARDGTTTRQVGSSLQL